jgi:hypothetical protein
MRRKIWFVGEISLMAELTPRLAGALNDGLKQLVTLKIHIDTVVIFPYEFVVFLLTDRFG